jgi:carboxypeptidase Q
MRILHALVSAALVFQQQGPPAPAPAAPAERDRPDEAVNAFLRQEGLDHSQVMDHLSSICDVYGPRLTGSQNLHRAQEWAVKTFTEWGLANAHLEDWGPFGRGWRLDHFHMDVVGENPWPVLAWPKAWSPGTPGVVEADAVLVADLTPEQIDALDLTGKFVLIESPRKVSEPFEARGKRNDAEALLLLADGRTKPRPGATPAANPPAAAPAAAPVANAAAAAAADGAAAAPNPEAAAMRESFRKRNQMMLAIQAKHPLALLDRASKGDYGTIFVQGASTPTTPFVEPKPGEDPRAQRGRGPRPWSADVKEVLPQVTLAVEHYNRIARLLERHLPVRISMRIDATFVDDSPMEHNVVAELPGSDPALSSQLVMLGAHYDSWQSGTGATDNGCGSAVVMETMRLLAKLSAEQGKAPRRTIRAALWSGEEEGLLGSKAYVEQHFGTREKPTDELAKLSGYFNLDNGTGKIRGIYLQGNEACGPIFRSWFKPFHDLDAATITLNNTGGTDHQSFDAVGLPGFQFIQDPISYDTQTHHSNMDVWDHAIAEDLRQAATIMASFVWHTAQRDEMLPRKPAPPQRPERSDRSERSGRTDRTDAAPPAQKQESP